VTAEVIEVSVQIQPTTVTEITVGPASTAGQLNLQVWTAVSEDRVSGQPTWRRALVVLDGLTRALDARIYESADGISVEDADTGVFGAGDSFYEAVKDLREALQDHLVVLTEEDSLSPNLQHQLDVLRSYFPPR
jgi:predicted RNase H-like HicB family nuclease